MKTPPIALLDNTNYHVWCSRLKMLLASKDLWPAVDPGNVAPEINQKAQSLIGLHVCDEFVPTVIEAPNAREAWLALQALFQASSMTRKLALTQELNELRLDTCMATYINRGKQLQQELAGCGHVVSSAELAGRLLMGLPKAYSTIVTVLESTAGDKLDINVVTTRLMQFEAKLTKENTTDAHALAARVGNFKDKKTTVYKARGGGIGFGGSNRNCWICGETGHISKDCPDRKNNKLAM